MKEPSASGNGGVLNQFIAVGIVNLLIFIEGSALGWVSPVLPVLAGKDSPLGDPLTDSEFSLVASSFCIGAIIGAPVFGWLSDFIGRKRSILVASVPFMISWSLKIAGINPVALICARLIVGMGGSGIVLMTPMYTGEVASLDSRGTLGSFLIFAFNIGIVFIYTIGAYVNYFAVPGILLGITVVFFILMSRMPETPSYLVKTNKIEEAIKSLAWLRKLPADSDVIKKEIEMLIAQSKSTNTNLENANVSPWKYLFTSRASLKAFGLTTFLLSAQIFMGIFVILVYANSIFIDAGSTLSPAVSSIIVGILQLVGSVIATVLVDRLGRKILLLISCTTVSLSTACLGTFFYVKNCGHDVSHFGWIPIIALSTCVCTFSIGIGPIPYILYSEVFVVQVRSLASSIGFTWMWVCTFVVTQFYTSAISALGSHGVFWGFALFGVLTILIIYFFLPETKGVPIDDLVALLEGKRDNKTARQNVS